MADVKSNDLAKIIQTMNQGSQSAEIDGPRNHYQFSEHDIYYPPRDYYAYPYPIRRPYIPPHIRRSVHTGTETVLSVGAMTLAFIVAITMFAKRKLVVKNQAKKSKRLDNRTEYV